MKKLLFTLLAFLPLAVYAQKGTIRGSVFDSNGYEVISGTVAVEGTTMGTITDLGGKFSIQLDPDTYTLNVSYVGFQTLTISEVVVTAGEITLLNNLKLQEEATVIGERSRHC